MTCQILAEYFSSFLLPWNSYILLFSLDFFFSWDWISLFSPGYPRTLNSVWDIQRLRIQACTITSKFKSTVLTSWLHLPFQQFLHIIKVKWELKVHHILAVAASSVSPRMLSSFHKQEYICLLLFNLQGLAKTTNLLTLSVMSSFPVSPHHNAHI